MAYFIQERYVAQRRVSCLFMLMLDFVLSVLRGGPIKSPRTLI